MPPSCALLGGFAIGCCGNITRTRNVSEYMLVLAVCLVIIVVALVCALILFKILALYRSFIYLLP